MDVINPKTQSIFNRSANQYLIHQAKLKSVEVPLPLLPKQKKISPILSTVQRAIKAQERIIQTPTELKKALMHKLFTEGLRHELMTAKTRVHELEMNNAN